MCVRVQEIMWESVCGCVGFLAEKNVCFVFRPFCARRGA